MRARRPGGSWPIVHRDGGRTDWRAEYATSSTGCRARSGWPAAMAAGSICGSRCPRSRSNVPLDAEAFQRRDSARLRSRSRSRSCGDPGRSRSGVRTDGALTPRGAAHPRPRLRQDEPDAARPGHARRRISRAADDVSVAGAARHADVHAARGPFGIDMRRSGCPPDRTNLVWRAADALWRAAGRAGEPRGLRVRIEKRIPLAGGARRRQQRCGRGAAGAAPSLWSVELTSDRLRRIAAGARRRRALLPRGRNRARARPRRPPVSACPTGPRPGSCSSCSSDSASAPCDAFRVVADAATEHRAASGPPARGRGERSWRRRSSPVIRRSAGSSTALRAVGAHTPAMSGSGSAVFGLFGDRRGGRRRRGRAEPARRVLVTRTLGARRVSTPRPARGTGVAATLDRSDLLYLRQHGTCRRIKPIVYTYRLRHVSYGHS